MLDTTPQDIKMDHLETRLLQLPPRFQAWVLCLALLRLTASKLAGLLFGGSLMLGLGLAGGLWLPGLLGLGRSICGILLVLAWPTLLLGTCA